MVEEGCLTENSSDAVADGICDEEEQQGVAERGPGSVSSDMTTAIAADSDDSTISRRHVAEDAPITVFERGAATRHDDDVDGIGGGGGDDAAEDSPLQLQDISLIL